MFRSFLTMFYALSAAAQAFFGNWFFFVSSEISETGVRKNYRGINFGPEYLFEQWPPIIDISCVRGALARHDHDTRYFEVEDVFHLTPEGLPRDDRLRLCRNVDTGIWFLCVDFIPETFSEARVDALAINIDRWVRELHPDLFPS